MSLKRLVATSKSILLINFILLSILDLSNAYSKEEYNQSSSGDNSPNMVFNDSFLIFKIDNNFIENGENPHFTIQYMRAFGAIKVPLFMKYVVSKYPDSTNIIAAPEFRKYWSERWKKQLYPITNNNIWNKIVGNQLSGLELYAKAVEPIKDDVISFFLSSTVCNEIHKENKTYKNDIKKILAKGFNMQINDISEDKLVGIDESQIGFLFFILENNSKSSFYDIELLYENVFGERINSFPHMRNKPNADTFRLGWESPRDIGLTEEDIANSTEKISSSHHIACVRSGEAIIWLLSIYKAKKDGMPEYYLTDVQTPIVAKFIAKNRPREQKIRKPYGLKAARIALPKDWLSMGAWIGQ